MDLSQKFDQLAEQSVFTDIAQLRHALASLDDCQPNPSSIPNNSGSVGLIAVTDATPPQLSTASNLNTPFSADPEPRNTNALRNSIPHAASVKRRRNVATRRFVKRVRSVKPAASKRIRVRARKSDRKPKQRTATEEITKGSRSIFTSLGLFALSVFILRSVTWQLEDIVPLDPIVAAFATDVEPVDEAQPVEPPEEEQGEQTEQEVEEPSAAEPEPLSDTEMTDASAPEADVISKTDVAMASVNIRSDAGRKAMLQKYGGSQASEAAVRMGLEWLASLQHAQGWWDFGNVGPSGNAGTINNPIGGTAYALLPFLAAGQTHHEGDYQKLVAAGLNYLTNDSRRLRPAGHGQQAK